MNIEERTQAALAALGAGPHGQRKRATIALLAQNTPIAHTLGRPDTASYRQWYGGRNREGRFVAGWGSDRRVQRALLLARQAALFVTVHVDSDGGDD